MEENAIVADAENALRAVMLISRDPLARCASLAPEIFQAFAKATLIEGESPDLVELKAAFVKAHARLWLEFGGDPDSIPSIM